MTQWSIRHGDRRTSYCPIALELRDEFTGSAPVGKVQLSLDYQQGTNWVETHIQPTKNAGGIYLYTGLGFALNPAAVPVVRTRIRIKAEHYLPTFRTTDSGLEFNVPTYNNSVPPAVSPLMPEIVLMLPTASYPFGGHVRVLRGRVLNGGGEPVADALLEADGVERAMTIESGAFSLPLRWQAPMANVNVQVDHPRTGTSATKVFSLPGDLVGNHDIVVT